jgi:tetratricopeptide (TPR) repeat protein
LRTLKPFIDAAGTIALSLLLTGCVSLSDRHPEAKSSEPIRPSDQKADGPVSGGTKPIVLEPPGPPPEVTDDNAADFEAAVADIREGRYQDAEIVLLGITSDQPELAGPWINLGQVYVALNQPEEARRAFEAAAAANPWNCIAHNELGLLSRQHGDFEAAEQHYLNCLSRVPDDPAANLNLGILYELYLGRLPEALDHYRQYQAHAAEPDRRVRGWVVDLERRLGV